MDLNALVDSIAEVLVESHDRIRKVAEPLSDEDLETLIQECRRLSGPTESRTFPMPEWVQIAKLLETEKGMRLHLRRADALFEATGDSCYCFHCGGTCKGHD